jgi:hypothetical protein
MVLRGQMVQIESWFDLTGESPKNAKVEVFRANDQLLTSGRLNDEGVFVFPYTQVESLRVVVSAGAGHRKELTIPEADLAKLLGSQGVEHDSSAFRQDPPSPAVLQADRSPRVSFKDVMIGIAFLLAAAAFVLGVRNARELQKWNRQRSGSE